jgi:hypothetical protein
VKEQINKWKKTYSDKDWGSIPKEISQSFENSNKTQSTQFFFTNFTNSWMKIPFPGEELHSSHWLHHSKQKFSVIH